MRLAALVLTAILTLCLTPVAYAEDAPRELIVTGEGRVATEPDMALLTLGVSREADTAKAAMDAASGAVADVLKTLSDQGIEPRDMQTSSVSLSPRWERQQRDTPPKITGYVASNSLSIRVRDLDVLGGVMDKVVGSGANQMNGLFFTLADPRPAEDDAREKAVADAVAKARLLARAAGVEFGPILRLSEGGSGGPAPVMVQREAMMASDVPIAAGEVDIRANVTIVFEIVN